MRMNRLAAIVLTAAAASAGNAAWGLSTSSGIWANIPIGTCYGYLNMQSAPRTYALVGISPNTLMSALMAAGGTFFYWGSAPFSDPRLPGLSVSGLQSSCGLRNVTNLVQNGADGTDVTDDYMGFSFRAMDLDGQTYDYNIALTGVSNTQATITKTIAAVGPSAQEQLIAGLQSERMNQSIANQPDLSHFLDGDRVPQVSMSALDGTGNLDASYVKGPFWGQITASWADAGAADSRYVMGSFGAHRKLSDNAAIGVMAQLDHISLDDPLGRAKGDGWMVGPYIVAKVPEHELYFDARALWGRTDNDITVTGAPTDNVDGIRSLVMLRASTRFDYGDVKIRPRAELARARESTGTFVDGLGTPIPAGEGRDQSSRARCHALARDRAFGRHAQPLGRARRDLDQYDKRACCFL